MSNGTRGGLPIAACTHTCYGRFFSAERASLVLSNVEDPEVRLQGIIYQQTTREGVSYSEYQLEDLGGLNQANLPGHNGQDPYLASGRNQLIARRSGHEAAQTGATTRRVEYARLPLKSRCPSVNIRFFRKEAGIIQQVFCRKVIRAIKDDVETVHDVENVTRDDPFVNTDQVDLRIEPAQCLPGRFHF